MSWFSSIHVATTEVDRVVTCLKRVRERACFVGMSGDRWVGIYSRHCEETSGLETPKLTSNFRAALIRFFLEFVYTRMISGFGFSVTVGLWRSIPWNDKEVVFQKVENPRVGYGLRGSATDGTRFGEQARPAPHQRRGMTNRNSSRR